MPLINEDDKTIVRSYTKKHLPRNYHIQYKTTVRRIIITPKIIATLRKQFGWDEDKFYLVDRDIICPVYEKHKRNRSNLPKNMSTNFYQLENELTSEITLSCKSVAPMEWKLKQTIIYFNVPSVQPSETKL